MKINKEKGTIVVNGTEFTLAKCVVELENGKCGVVLNWGDVPSHIIFDSYSRPLSVYNEDGTIKNVGYNIVAIYDATAVTDQMQPLRKSFKLDALPKLYTRE